MQLCNMEYGICYYVTSTNNQYATYTGEELGQSQPKT